MAKSTDTYFSFSGRRLHNLLLGMKRTQKKVVLMVMDAIAVPAALWFAYVLRIGPPSTDLVNDLMLAFLLSPVFAVLAFWYFGLYNTLIRSMENRTMLIVATASVLTGLFLALLSYFVSSLWVPRSVPSIFAIVVFLFVGALRVVAKTYYGYAVGLSKFREPVLIYGAGSVGLEAASALESSQNYSVVGFIDDDRAIQGNTIRGRTVYAPDNLDIVTRRHENSRVLIAIADQSPAEKRELIQKLDKYKIRIESIPAFSDVVSGKANLSQIEKVKIEDLLGREVVPPIADLFANALQGKSVLVSGAGGSIGSEICRQVFLCSPEKLILLEQSELNLYQLEQSLDGLKIPGQPAPEVISVLGDATDENAVTRVFDQQKPEIVYHAAAYKHVPIVENNACEGIRNNVFGTQIVAKAAEKSGAERFILISTDKAVRPTNVMGATKRVAEQVIQNLADARSNTIFSMVRFGNVLGSSGSVIPLFKSQIAARKPVTVTHREVTRYFMTIPEAAQLVVQAGFMAKGGEVFVLNMGDPIKILDLAKLMIQLSGYRVRDEENPMGDIPIEITGMRPGEKLYEELLIGGDDLSTEHPKVFCAMESTPGENLLKSELLALTRAINGGDDQSCRKSLAKLVEGFPG